MLELNFEKADGLGQRGLNRWSNNSEQNIGFLSKLVLYQYGFSNYTGPVSVFNKAESTKQMEQTLRAKVKIFFKSENLKKCF